MEETKPRGCKWDTEAKLDRHTQRQTQTTLYMEHKGRDSDRQSFRRGGEREGSRVGIYQPSAQHLRCHPLPILLSAAQKYLSGKISHKTALNRWILRWKRSVNRYKTVEMWESGVIPLGQVGGRSGQRRRGSLERRSVNLPRTFLSLIQSNLTPLCLNLKIPGIYWWDISPKCKIKPITRDFLTETKMLKQENSCNCSI